MPPKTERGGSVPNEFAPNLPRSVFLLRRASPPCPMKSGRFRAQHTATPAGAAPRAAFGYSRANWDSTRTLRGRSARGARIGRPSIGGASGHFKHEGGRRARRGRCLGRGKNSAGSGDSLEIVHLFPKRIGDAWREAIAADRGWRIAAKHRRSDRSRVASAADRNDTAAVRESGDTAAGAPFGRPRCGRLPSLRSAWRQNGEPKHRGSLGGWGDLALRGNAGKAQQAQAKRGWGGAKAGSAAKREPSAALHPRSAALSDRSAALYPATAALRGRSA